MGEDSVRGAAARQEIANRIASAERAKRRSMARPFTEAQWTRLSEELGVSYPPHVVRFVEWANGLHSGQGTLRQPPWYEKPNGLTWLSRVYWIEAINLAINGFNSHYTEAELMAEAQGQSESEYLDDGIDELEQLALWPMEQAGLAK